MSRNTLINTIEKLNELKAEKIRLDSSLKGAYRKLRTFELDEKQGRSIPKEKMEEAKNWVLKLEGRLTLVESSINVISNAVSRVSSRSKVRTASGKSIRM